MREIEANGWDPHNVFAQFLIYTRDALHLALGGQPDSVDLPLEEAEALAELVRPHGYENLLRLSDHMLMSEPTVRRSEFALLALELAWLRAAELPKLTRIEDLLSGATTATEPSEPNRNPSSPTPPPRSTAPRNVSTRNARPAEARPAQISSKTRQETPRERQETTRTQQETPRERQETTRTRQDPPKALQAEPEPVGDTAPRTATPASGGRIDAFREQLNSRRQPLAALVESAKLFFEDGRLSVRPQPGDSLLASALKREKNAALFDQLIREIWGENATWSLEAAPVPTPQNDPRSSARQQTEDAAKDPTVKTVLEVFGGSIQNVQLQGN